MIEPELFITKMENRWVNQLGNVSSSALRKVWKQLADIFNTHIQNHTSTTKRKQWTVLQPPTGSGKTQGTVVYCSLLSTLFKDEDHPGVLIITRLREDAEAIANQINTATGSYSAIAYHSKRKSEVKLKDLCKWPVVVITHRAYELALDYLGQDGTIQDTWPYFHDWKEGTRSLVVIDEALDIIEHSQASLDGLRQTLGVIPQGIRKKYPEEVAAIEYMVDLLDEIENKTSGSQSPEFIARTDKLRIHETPDFTALRAAMMDFIKYDNLIGKDDEIERRRLANIHDKRLLSLHNIFRSWTYYARCESQHTFNTARLLVPEDVKGAVVLDATATSNVMYQLFDEAQVIVPPPHSRTYRNVTLHVSRGHKVGKRYMSQNADTVSAELISELNTKLKDRKVFICTHKPIEHCLVAKATNFELKTGHWGAVDGVNHWKDCDAAVMFGLPYRPDTWTANVFMALQGAQTTEWLRSEDNRSWGEHTDIRQALKTGQMITNLVQAINRVRCRKTIDSDGNCEATDIFILLPDNSLSDELIEGIKREMPDIQVEDWNIKAAKSKEKQPKASRYEEALKKYIENMEVGRKSIGAVRQSLGASSKTMERLRAKLRDSSSSVSTVMQDNSVSYVTQGKGRASKTWLVKEWTTS